MKVARKLNWSKIGSEIKSNENPNDSAFTLTDLIVVLAIIAVFAAMLLRAQASTRADAQRIQCANNLKRIGLAFRIWAANHNDLLPMAVERTSGGAMPYTGWTRSSSDGQFTYSVFQVMSNELNTPKVVICPGDDRIAATNFNAFPTLGADFVNNLKPELRNSYWLNSRSTSI